MKHFVVTQEYALPEVDSSKVQTGSKRLPV